MRASLELGAPTRPGPASPSSSRSSAGDWRLLWYSAQCALLEGEFDKAAADFDTVLATLPGELAPKLALAATAELRGAREDAQRYYEMVWRTDHGYVSAAFGLARQRALAGDRVGAVAALDEIPACLFTISPMPAPPRSRSCSRAHRPESGRADVGRRRASGPAP